MHGREGGRRSMKDNDEIRKKVRGRPRQKAKEKTEKRMRKTRTGRQTRKGGRDCIWGLRVFEDHRPLLGPRRRGG